MKGYWVVMASVVAAAACGGGGEKASSGATTAAAPPVTPAPAGGAAAAAPGAAVPITGKTWDVKMVGDAAGYRFEPATLTISSGDGVKFTVVSGPPHNVTFWTDSIPGGAVATLGGNMPQTMAPLTGPMLLNLNDTYVVSFGGTPPGTYHFYCTPHLAFNMKGTITVK